MIATELGQVAAGGDAQLGGQALDQHRHQVAGDHDPEQRVAELVPAFDIGGKIARVDIGDAGNEGRAEKGQQSGQALVPVIADQHPAGSLDGFCITAAGTAGPALANVFMNGTVLSCA